MHMYIYTQGGEPKNALPDAAVKVRPSQLKSAAAVKSWQHNKTQKTRKTKTKGFFFYLGKTTTISASK